MLPAPKDDNSIRMLAQSLSSDVGKTLRLTEDGGIPKDNPFVGRAGAKPEIFTYGHRNGFGLAFHPETGELWQLEIGPMGGDEVNILKPGTTTAGRSCRWAATTRARSSSDQPWYREGMDDPRMFWVPAISPAGMAFYTGDKFPDWKNNLIVGALTGSTSSASRSISRARPSGARCCCASWACASATSRSGPDGYIYFATEVRYGSGKPDGAVIRIEPAQ